jgi:hypothetical protein
MHLLTSENSSLVNNAHNELAADTESTHKNPGTEMNELIKIDQIVAKRRGIM